MKKSIFVFIILLTSIFSEPILLPSSLAPGSTYHLVFITSGTTNAGSSDINTYNAFVQNIADTTPELAALGATWSAIASTSDGGVDARDNINITSSIFNLADTLVANDDADLFDGTIAAPINVDEFGNILNASVWTGSNSDGTGSAGNELGSGGSGSSNVVGNSSAINGGWMFNGSALQTSNLHFYAISSELTIPSSNPIPEPSTYMLFLCGLVVLGLRRKSKN